MHELDLFRSAPRRSAKERISLISDLDFESQGLEDYLNYGYDYWDNPSFGVGYGGYFYDGRYKPAVQRMVEYFGLAPGDRVLEIGCAKGFILYEFHSMGFVVTGVDASHYAISNAKEEVRDAISLNQTAILPFADDSFDLVLAKEVLPHIEEADVATFVGECMRVAKGPNVFFEIQCADTAEGEALMKKWDMTHKLTKSPLWWTDRLARSGYTGAYFCKLIF